jgi:hypothetical protein
MAITRSVPPPAPRDGVLANRVEVDAPEDLALASDGSILYVDGITGAIRRVGLDGRLRTVFSGELDSPRRRGPTVEAMAVATLPDGTVLIAEDGIVVLVAPGRTLPRVAGNAKERDGGDGGHALEASLSGAGPPASLPDGSLLVLETTGNHIRRVRADGIIEPAAGTGARGFSGDGGPATLATFQLTDDEGMSGDVAAVADGGFLIADSGNNCVRRVWPDGRVTTVAGDGLALSRGNGGPATAASLNTPQGVVAMPSGGFVVADTFGRRLRTCDPTARSSRGPATACPGHSAMGRRSATAGSPRPRSSSPGESGWSRFRTRTHQRGPTLRPDHGAASRLRRARSR